MGIYQPRHVKQQTIGAGTAPMRVVDDKHQRLPLCGVNEHRRYGRGNLAGEPPSHQFVISTDQQDVVEDRGMGEQAGWRQFGTAEHYPQRGQQAAPALITRFAAIKRHPLHLDAPKPGGQDLDQQAGFADAGRPRNQRTAAPPLVDAV